MTSRDFCFWLQGYLELAPAGPLSAEQAECVRRHLSLVFQHEIDPSMGDAKHQAELDATHGQRPPPKPAPPAPGSPGCRDHVVMRC